MKDYAMLSRNIIYLSSLFNSSMFGAGVWAYIPSIHDKKHFKKNLSVHFSRSIAKYKWLL